jgi:hypothetical protein
MVDRGHESWEMIDLKDVGLLLQPLHEMRQRLWTLDKTCANQLRVTSTSSSLKDNDVTVGLLSQPLHEAELLSQPHHEGCTCGQNIREPSVTYLEGSTIYYHGTSIKTV